MSLQGAIRRVADTSISRTGQMRFGIVTSVDPNSYTAKVQIMPDGATMPPSQSSSGWFPIASQWIGNGWGMICPPEPGDQVVLEPQDGDANNLIITGRIFSQAQRLPVGIAGEFWLVHQSGASLKLQNSGAISINAPEGLLIDANVTVTGTITATGDIVAGEGGEDISVLGHLHTSETPGTPTSAPISGT